MKIKKILLLFSIIILGLIYITLLDNYFSVEKPKFSTEKKEDVITDSTTVDKILNFINDYEINNFDYANILFNDINSLSNQEKLLISYLALKNEVDFSKGVSYTKLESYIRTIFGKDVVLENEDLQYKEEEILKFDSSNDIYTLAYLEELNLNLSKYNYIVDFKNNGSEYVLTVNKFFEENNKVYVTYGDLQNEMNVLFEIPVSEENKTTYIKNYVNSNYLEIENNLSIYTYTFTKEDGSLILISYKKEK